MADQDHILKSLFIEQVGEINSTAVSRTVVPTAASTTVLTLDSTSQHIFTGSVAGKIMQLPNATTLRLGLTYLFWNVSSQSVTVKYNDTTTYFTISPSESVNVTLYDNTTTNGAWAIGRRSSIGTAAMPMHFGQTVAGANLYLFESTSSKTTSDALSPPFARNMVLVGWAFNCVTFTAGKSMMIRSASNLTIDKAKIDLTAQTCSGWNSAGFTTFSANERPSVYLKRNTRQQVTGTPTISTSSNQTWTQTINGTPYSYSNVVSKTINLAFTSANNRTYTIVINGTTCTYTSPGSGNTLATVAAGIINAINTAVGGAVTATGTTSPVTVTGNVVGVDFTYSGAVQLTVTDTTAVPTATTICNALRTAITDPMVTTSGTTTLIMTGPINGDVFTYSSSANLTDVQTFLDDGTTITEPRFIFYYMWND